MHSASRLENGFLGDVEMNNLKGFFPEHSNTTAQSFSFRQMNFASE
jgi:hypothetical protein